MNDAYASVQLAADGVGLPSSYSLDLPGMDGEIETGIELQSFGMVSGAFVVSMGGWLGPFSTEEATLNFTHQQTAFGLGAELDVWERKRPDYDVTEVSWVQQLVNALAVGGIHLAGFLRKMSDRITHIGRDHRIRRARRWTVEDGTLATLTQENHWNEDDCQPVWVLRFGDDVWATEMFEDMTSTEALQAIEEMTSIEALQAIHTEATS